MQLELALWPRGTLRRALCDYIAAVVHKIAPATLIDYQQRADWLCLQFGNARNLRELDFAALEWLVKEHGPRGRGLMMVTLRKRLRTLRAALTYAHDHGLVDRVPRLPPQLYDDGNRGQDFYTVEEFGRFSAAVPDGPGRRFYEIGFWTGHHSLDVRRYLRQWLDPGYVWTSDDGAVLGYGRYWRVNHKNRRCEGTWLAMEPEFRALATRWLEENPSWQDKTRIVGRVWPKATAARAASVAGLHYVRPSLGMRRSFATMLASRDYPPEYIRQALGHEGEAWIERQRGTAPRVHTSRPTTATAHYIRTSPDLVKHLLSTKGNGDPTAP